MRTLTDIVDEQQQQSPIYFSDADKDALLKLVLRQTEELCVLRDRIDTIGRLVSLGIEPTEDAVNAFDVSADLQQERLLAHRQTFLAVLNRFAELSRSP